MGPSSSAIALHVRNFQHRLRVLLHEVNLVGVRTIDVLHLLAQVILARVEVLRVCRRWNVSRGCPVRVGRENLREGVTHL